MASSLEELLAEDGFRGKRSTRARASSASDNITTMLYRSPGDHKPESSSRNRTRTQRTRSDASRYSLNEKTDSIGYRRPPPRDHLITRERTRGKGTKLLKGRHSVDRPRDRGFEISSNALSGDEIVEVGRENDERINDRYSSKGRKTFGEDKFPTLTDGRNQCMPKDTKPDRRDPSSSHKHLPLDLSSTQSGRTSMKQAGPSEDRRHEKHTLTLFDSLPSLDEVAIKATISILTGYITPFLKDENFRVALRSKCLSSLDFDESEEYQSGENKVMSKLKQAIETVERAAEEYADPKDLKRASIQLSVITGLNTGDMKDGLTCGVPNFKLSACAHLYLSLIYRMQKKDRVSAKHILQLFADSPLEGRTLLLPDLWGNFFCPHLSHLELWHTQEVESLVDVTGKATKMIILEKVYNEMLDLGTCQFAVYYKDWLTEDAEAPPFPSVNVPSVSFRTAEVGDSPSHSGELGNTVSAPHHQPMVSKKLYEAVFSRSNKPGAEDDEEGQNYQKGSVGSTSECNEALMYSCETVKHMDQHSVSNSTRHLGDEELSDGRILLLEAIDSPQKHKNDETSESSSLQQTTVKDESRCSREPNNLSKLQRLTISVFEPEQTEDFDIDVDIPSRPKAEPFCRGDENSDERHYAIPQYLVCPLTRRLFEDPVTLETGQTFEQAAIRKWFNEGNKSCPVTGTSLEYLGVPLTNMVVKCVVDSWKTEHSKSIFAFASRLMGEETQGHQFVHSDVEPICILEQLITMYSRDERKANAKRLLSLGGLHYLIRRFNVGKIEVNISVMPILICCIEADSSCRYEISKAINIQLILDLLQSKTIDVRRNAVSLLTELISLQRRKDVADILGALPNEEIVNAMHVLLLYLQTCPSLERPLVAALLLRFDQLVGPQKYSIYRDGAVDAIAVAMNLALTDANVKTACCKALTILFPLSGKLPEAGLYVSDTEFEENKEFGLFRDQSVLYGDEDPMFRKWLTYLLTSVTSDEKKPFLDAILKCLASGESSLVLACLRMVAWLSFALPSELEMGFKFSAFSALIFQLKENLKGGEEEHKMLASFCLLNFSKISECRSLLMTDSEAIVAHLRSVADISWTAKELYSVICSEDL